MKDKRTWWILAALIILAVRWVLTPQQIELFYSRSAFPIIRQGFDLFTGYLPFAVVYLFIPVVLGTLLYLIFRAYNKSENAGMKVLQILYTLTAFVSATVLFFMVLWGFNYGRMPVEEILGLETKEMTIEEIHAELEYHTSIISTLRKGLPDINDLEGVVPLTDSFMPKNMVDEMRLSLERVLAANGYPNEGHTQCRELYPEGSLLRFGTSGIYFPFTGEGHVDAALHPLQKPFVIAHELAHGYGFTDEGTCNFWAYLACIHSNNLFIRYVGHLNYWRYLAVSYKLARPDAYQTFRKQLPLEILADLNTINENLNRFPDILPGIRYMAYDTYLKSQGIEDGIANYDRVIPLVTAWWEKMKLKGS